MGAGLGIDTTTMPINEAGVWPFFDLVNIPPRDAMEKGDGVALTRYLTSVFRSSEIENRAAILRIIRARAPLPRVVDLGCHDGEFSVQVKEAAQAREVVGVEYLGEHARKARRHGIDVVVADLNKTLPFPAKSVDLVHANQVIEHLRNTDLFLSEIARVVMPGGLVVISTNNLASWHNIFSLLLGYQPFPSHVSDHLHVGNPIDWNRGSPHADEGRTHLRVFTGRALAELARYHGLELIDMLASGYYPLPPRLSRWFSCLDRRHAAFLIGVFQAPN